MVFLNMLSVARGTRWRSAAVGAVGIFGENCILSDPVRPEHATHLEIQYSGAVELNELHSHH